MTSSNEHAHSSDKGNARQRSLPHAFHKSDIITQQQLQPDSIIERAKRYNGSLTPSDVLQLQRTIGNQAVYRLLSQTVVQRLLADAQEEAKQQGVTEQLNSREDIINYLKKQPKPKPGQGVDKIRAAYNNKIMNLSGRIAYMDIWPEEIPQEVTDAKQWAQTFASEIPFDGLAAANGLTKIKDQILKQGGIRTKEGVDMLNKFIVYSTRGSEILNHLFSRFSNEYQVALGSALSSALAVESNSSASDEIFKLIPPQSDPTMLQSIGPDVFLEPLQEGLKNLQKAIDEKYDIDVIVEHFFLHDKGYLNAATPLNSSLAATYRKRLDETKQQSKH